MTTLTLHKELNLRKTHFEDLEELRDYIEKELDTDMALDFRPLKKSEITPAMKAKKLETKNLPRSRFTQLTRHQAHPFLRYER